MVNFQAFVDYVGLTWCDTFENVVGIYSWLVCDKATEWIDECLPNRCFFCKSTNSFSCLVI